MRLVTIDEGSGPRAAVLRGDQPVPIRGARGAGYDDLAALLAAPSGLDDARTARDGGAPIAGDWRFRAPVLEPGAVWCVGRNYAAHSQETGHSIAAAPVWFGKFARATADPGQDILLSAQDPALDYEGELAVVIGRTVRGIEAADAWSAVAGITLLNDVSARTLGAARQNVFFGKNLEASTPWGPSVVTLDETGPFEDLSFETRVNGELRQRGRGSQLIFDVPMLIADLAAITTLRPGDVIATGTPSGVAMSMDPPPWLADGDVVEISCPPMTPLRNRFVGLAG